MINIKSSRIQREAIFSIYLHKSCKPLGEANFQENQLTFEWFGECEGMCGT